MRILLLALALTAPAAAQSGALDPTFGTDGVVRFETAQNDGLSGLGLLDDGRLLLSAWSDHDSFLVRLLPSGAADPAFGTDGVIRFGTRLEAAGGLAVLPDGRFYVAGRAGPPTDLVLRRYLADGTLDVTFGAGGRVQTDLRGTADYASDVLLTPDGRIVIAGASVREAGSFETDLAVVRYRADGTLDDTFGDEGRAILDLGRRAYGYTARLQADGRLLVAGKLGGQFPSDAFVARLLPDGTLDPAFGTGGVVTLDYQTQDYASGLAVLPDGRIVVTGSSGFEEFQDLSRTRLLPDGTLDPTFENGELSLNGRETSGADVIGLPDGHLLVVGGRYAGPDNLLRLRPDGTLDRSFGDQGTLQGTFGSDAGGSRIVLQPDGKAVVAGWYAFPRSVAVARFLDVLPVAADAVPPSARLAVEASPNPFAESTTVSVSTSASGPVRVTVMDALGRRVAVLHDAALAAGTHRVAFDAATLAPGVYAVHVQTTNAMIARLVVHH